MNDSNFAFLDVPQSNFYTLDEAYFDIISITLNEKLRMQLEKFNSCQGFCIIHHAGEIAGSEVGMILHKLLNQICSNKVKLNFPIYSYSCKESFNKAIFEISTTSFLHKMSNIIFPLELGSMDKRLSELNSKLYLSYEKEFEIMSNAISTITMPIYKNNSLIRNLANFESILIPTKEYKFVSSWIYPLISYPKQNNSEIEIISQCFNCPSMIGIKTQNNIFLKNLVIFEGSLQDKSRKLINSTITNFNKCNSQKTLSNSNNSFLELNNQHTSSNTQGKMAICSNSSAIIPLFESVIRKTASIHERNRIFERRMENTQILRNVLSQKEHVNSMIECYSRLLKKVTT